MNKPLPSPASGRPIPTPRPKYRPRRSDQEFLGPALEILETPPSPIRLAMIVTIATLSVVTLAWAYFGRIDIIASAQGKFEPTGKVKIIEPLETGKVAVMPPVDGVRVREGDILLQLDPTEEIADEVSYRRGLASYMAEVTRRRVAIETARHRSFDPIPDIDWSKAEKAAAPSDPSVTKPDEGTLSSIPPNVRQREQAILRGDLEQLAADIASLDAQNQEKRTARDKLAATIQSQKSLIATLQDRVTMRTLAEQKQAETKASVIDATETYKYQVTQLTIQEGQLADADAAAAVLSREMDKTIEAFVSDNSQKLGEAERQVDDLTEKLIKARAERERKTVVSPIAGTVQASTITTVGQVVSPGEQVMRIVPDGSALQLQVYVRNTDIGFVKIGQEAVVKIQSFPFTRYGTITARVTNVATDAIPEPDANQLEGDPEAKITTSTFAGAERTQNLVFPVTLVPEKNAIDADGRTVAFTPGMAVTVEIKTDNRRILQYVFSPIVEVTSEAFKER